MTTRSFTPQVRAAANRPGSLGARSSWIVVGVAVVLAPPLSLLAAETGRPQGEPGPVPVVIPALRAFAQQQAERVAEAPAATRTPAAEAATEDAGITFPVAPPSRLAVPEAMERGRGMPTYPGLVCGGCASPLRRGAPI